MVSDFRVDPPALEQFAAASTDRGHEFDDLHTRMRGLRLPRDSFGYIPGIGGRVYDAYDEFSHGCTDAIASAAESMASIATAVRGVATAYLGTDQAAHDRQATIEADLDGIDIRGPR